MPTQSRRLDARLRRPDGMTGVPRLSDHVVRVVRLGFARREQLVALHDRLGDVEDPAGVAARVISEQVERRVRADSVPGHQDALRLLDDRTAD